MCRACFNPLVLHKDFLHGGANIFGDDAKPSRRFEASAVASDVGAEVIFKGGKIIPLPGAASAGALAIGACKILAIGDESAVEGLKGKNTKIVDLQGRVLMPGLIDSHNHTVLAALIFELLTDVGYLKYPTRASLLNALRAQAARTPPGQWIACSNFDNLLQGGDLSREELDGVSTAHPILLWYTNGHDACVNSLALKIAGISDDVGDFPGGGHFGRDEKGRLNGLVYEESAMKTVVLPALPKITPQLAAKAVTDYLRSVASLGATMVHEPGTLRSDWIAPFATLSGGLRLPHQREPDV